MDKSFESIRDIPPIGFGLWKIDREIIEQIVFEAIKSGYRHLDAACESTFNRLHPIYD